MTQNATKKEKLKPNNRSQATEHTGISFFKKFSLRNLFKRRVRIFAQNTFEIRNQESKSFKFI